MVDLTNKFGFSTINCGILCPAEAVIVLVFEFICFKKNTLGLGCKMVEYFDINEAGQHRLG